MRPDPDQRRLPTSTRASPAMPGRIHCGLVCRAGVDLEDVVAFLGFAQRDDAVDRELECPRSGSCWWRACRCWRRARGSPGCRARRRPARPAARLSGRFPSARRRFFTARSRLSSEIVGANDHAVEVGASIVACSICSSYSSALGLGGLPLPPSLVHFAELCPVESLLHRCGAALAAAAALRSGPCTTARCSRRCPSPPARHRSSPRRRTARAFSFAG